MRKRRSIVGPIAAIVPVAYCGGLIAFFLRDSSLEDAVQIGLGPTLLGLAVVGFLFCIPLLYAIIRKISGPRRPRTGGPGAPTPDGGGGNGADIDAMIARHMARMAAEPASAAPAASELSSPSSGGKAQARPGFGRKGG